MLRLLAALLLAASASAAAPDLILTHGRIFVSPGVFAQALAVSGNRIDEIGDDASVLQSRGPRTVVWDLQGRAVTPGFHDAHARFFTGALSLSRFDLAGSDSIADIQRRLARYALERPKDEWILGRGWAASRLSEGRPPAKEDLDAVISTRPVVLESLDGETLWLNSEALKRAGIGKTSGAEEPRGIQRSKTGEPTGLLADDARALAFKAMPAPKDEDLLAAARKALALARESGVTAFDVVPGAGDPSASDELRLWSKLYRKGQATARFFVYGRLEDAGRAEDLRRQAAALPPTRAGLVGLAAALDGGLDERSAALLEPYFDESGASGRLRYDRSRLEELARAAARQDLQVDFLATGDKAVRLALDVCGQLEKEARKRGDVLEACPCRIDGAALVAPEDLPRFSALNAAASVEPAAAVHDDQQLNFAPERLGDRVRRVYAWRSLESAGALLAFGSGWPARPLSPTLALFAATARQNLDGKPAGGWFPTEKIDLDSAISHYTFDPARAIGRGEELGQLAAGKLADLVVFDRDLFALSGPDILKARVDATIYDGRVVYRRP